ncbi:TolC family protein [Elongatibacter sediminis]|uniref:TolC family protein n=1 Tax=Elongatibacter sediminis TaxID=3119006 RepID=A0AAW9RFC7_9GAMM
MHWMRMDFRCTQISGLILASIVMLMSPLVGAETLSLAEAETLAISNDPSVESVKSRQVALNELEVAAGQLPDPQLKFGLMSLPTDTFNLGQEPMTQVQVGVVQRFPRGQSRKLRAAQLRERSKALGDTAEDRLLGVSLAVRENYLEVLKQVRLAVINKEAEAAFTDLEDITQEYYATGRVQQQDVLRAAVELAKVQERSVRISEEEQRARGRLAAWIGDDAWRDINPDWPLLTEPSAMQSLKDGLVDHPRIRALHQEVIAAEKGIELAEQSYKPEFAVDLTYGGRGGENPDGSSRADLLSLMVRMDVPLFTGNRQDRIVQASIASSSAAAFNRDDIYRLMSSEAEVHHAAWQRQKERLELYESSLLPDAEYNSLATFDAYQAALEDMTTLMRARITEFDLQLEHARLKAESFKSQARLLYLEGK